MFGTDVVVIESASFLLRIEDNLSRPFSKALPHGLDHYRPIPLTSQRLSGIDL